MLTPKNLKINTSDSPLKGQYLSTSSSTSLEFQTHNETDLRPLLNFAPSSILNINDKGLICIGGYDGTLTLWDSESLELIVSHPKFSHDPILDIRYYEKKEMLIIFSSTIRIAKITTSNQIKCLKTLNSNYFNNQFLGIAEEEGLLITKTSDYRCNIYSLNTFVPYKRFSLENKVEAFHAKSLWLCLSDKKILVTFCNNKLEGYNILSGKKLWVHRLKTHLRSDIVAISYCKQDNTIVGIVEDGEIMLWRLGEKKCLEVTSSCSFKLNNVGHLSQSIGTTAGGQILVRDINKVFCINVQQKDFMVIPYKDSWAESVLFTDLEKEKVFALSWTTRVIRVISLKEVERENSPKRALKKIDNWLKTMWNMVGSFATV